MINRITGNRNERLAIWAREAAMRARTNRLGSVVLVAMVSVVVVGCADPSPTSPRASAVGSPPGPVRAQDTDDHYRLAFELPKATWRTTEPVTGTATLTLVAPNSTTVWGSGSGIVGFEWSEIGPEKTDIGWLRTPDCESRRVEPSTPVVSSLTNLYGADRNLYLTAGDWRIAAVTDFTEDQCGVGVRHDLHAGLLIHVVP
jgi:hypothetical protein